MTLRDEHAPHPDRAERPLRDERPSDNDRADRPPPDAPRTQRQRMLAGELYDARDPDLTRRRARARDLMARYNVIRQDERAAREAVLRELFGRCGERVWIEPPFYCDYGDNIEMGDFVFLNFGCVLLDAGPIRLGRNVMAAPYVQFYAAHHPIDARERIKGPELASPITVGDNVWLGGGVIICPGVTIGENTTIGAGSVVTKDIPAGVLAVGNPCRVIRQLE
jgi:maltose O-acetyltransferase